MNLDPGWRMWRRLNQGNRGLGRLLLAASLFLVSPLIQGQLATNAVPRATGASNAAPATARFAPATYPTFAEWKAACDRLPTNRSLKQRLPAASLLPLKNFGQFAEVLDAFLRLEKNSALASSSAWLGQGPLTPQFFNTDATYFFKPPIPFQPFVQRALVPPGTELLFHGDLHGDIHALVAWVDWLNRNGYLRDFTIVRPDVYLVFLGDYTDRGLYGIEVLYTMLRLKVENPDRVLLVRGNHEDVSLAARYGFIAECRGKFGDAFDLKHVMRLYDFLPLALYLGCETNVIQCNHGGMEPGFNPRALLDAPDQVQFQLLGRLNQQQFLKEHPDFASALPNQTRRLMQAALLDYQPQSPTEPLVIGFMWNDFSVVRGEPQFDFDPGRAFVYGESTTKYLLNYFSTGQRHVQAVFRAHQHATILNGMMRRLKVGHGVYRHWQENDSLGLMDADLPVIAQKIELSEERRIPPLSVWTFNVVPDSVYGEACDFSFDTFGILTTAAAFENWKLRVVNQTTYTEPKTKR
jgi:hypothetical protein